MGDKLKIRLASSPEGPPAAAILTIRFRATMTYKYGCSDSRFHKLGPMQLLLWKAIQEAKETGLLEFDMGRTDLTNEGLLIFKDRWGRRSTLKYLRYPAPEAQRAAENISVGIARSLFGLAPNSLLRTAGKVLYPHVD
jgi:Acetyltransferase (GNAT) domain